MKILVLHPDDEPLHGPWSEQSWDLIFDLGVAGWNSYKRWGEALGCPVQGAERIGDSEFDQIRAFLNSGLGRVVDKHGLDWWDLISLEFLSEFERWATLQKLAHAFSGLDEVFVSRESFESRALQRLIGNSVRTFPAGNSLWRKLKHYSRLLATLSPAQVIQIFGDKYDSGYRIRRILADRRKSSDRGVILLPSAYVNVSRTELQFAEMMPESDFLLVTTRQSGWVSNPPTNVRVAKLASYARRNPADDDFEDLLSRWHELKEELACSESFGDLVRSGLLDGFVKFLRKGLLIRDAWLEFFDREPVRAVLCADDANLPTRIPLKIAVNRGLPALSCHHGAMDGRYRMRPKHDGMFLAKGRMEYDYLLTVCGSPRSALEIGGPAREFTSRQVSAKQAIVFFSEPYEILGGRAAEFYRDVLPPLADAAAANNRDLVIKLHPVESPRQRAALAKSVLSEDQYERVRFVTGRLTDELLSNAWFAVTVLSTTALECSLRGVPAFLCGWLDYSSYGYLDHMAKFGAGTRLHSPEELLHLARRLENTSRPIASRLWEAIAPDRLEDLLAGEARRVVTAV